MLEREIDLETWYTQLCGIAGAASVFLLSELLVHVPCYFALRSTVLRGS